MAEDTVYLDYNATTPVVPEVFEAMQPYFGDRFGNPSSSHVYGRRAREGLEAARREVAELLGVRPGEIVFTGSGTEANNLAIRGTLAAGGGAAGGVALSAIEHPSVEQPCRHLEQHGADVFRVGVDDAGRVELERLERALEQGVELVTVMHANNETGVLQPVGRVVELAEEYGALVHTDASQTVGKIGVDVDELGVDLLTVTGHKFYAPKGVGALYVREGLELAPVLRGASHEAGIRPGTENVPGAVGLGRACSYADNRLDERERRMRALRERLWRRLRDRGPAAVRHGEPERTLPNTLNMRFQGVAGDELLECADEVAASTGSACHEGGSREPSSVLVEMGIDPDDALGAVRLSVGEMTTEAEIDRAAESLVRAAESLLA